MTEPLRTDFKNEILPDGMTHRGYNIMSATDEILFSDVHLEKSYIPLQQGDEYGEDEINLLNTTVNQNIADIVTVNSTVTNNYSTLDDKINKTNVNLETLSGTVTDNFNTLDNKKIDKDGNKVLSTHDFNDGYKNQLDNLESVLASLGNTVIKVVRPQEVTADKWVNDSTFIDYPYKATIPVEGLNADSWWCEILTPDHDDPTLLTALSPYVYTELNGFSIYSSVKFDKSIFLENVVFEREVLK